MSENMNLIKSTAIVDKLTDINADLKAAKKANMEELEAAMKKMNEEKCNVLIKANRRETQQMSEFKTTIDIDKSRLKQAQKEYDAKLKVERMKHRKELQNIHKERDQDVAELDSMIKKQKKIFEANLTLLDTPTTKYQSIKSKLKYRMKGFFTFLLLFCYQFFRRINTSDLIIIIIK